MVMSVKIPVPITFNPYKHHFGFLREEIVRLNQFDQQTTNQILCKIGNNLFDFYIGQLSIEQICFETIDFFEQKEITNLVAFKNWLIPNKWKKIVFSDYSEWLIKQGNIRNRYIHIHPAKHSVHTIRIRANTLKTVLALKLNSIPLSSVQLENLRSVNKVRQEWLNLSPIKSIHNSSIFRLWLLFQFPL